MEREIITKMGPVCRFGPGGDYESIWPDDWTQQSQQPKNALAGLLNVLTGIIDVLRGPAREYSIEGPAEINELSDQETTKNVSKPGRAYASTGPDVKHNRWISDQPGLFADDWRAGGTIKYKPNYRIRAHRAVAKKRSCFRPGGQRFDKLTTQGTLFETDFKGAKTA
jgi:hypothetical protein